MTASEMEEESLWEQTIVELEVPLTDNMVEPEKTDSFGNGWQNIMTDDFEGSFPGSIWTVTSHGLADAYWGKEDFRNHIIGGSYSLFCAAERTDAIDPPTNYPEDIHTRMIYGPFSLVDSIDAELSFYCFLFG